MTRPLLLLPLALLTGACASTSPAPSTGIVTQASLPANALTVDCSGDNAGWVFCYRRAEQICGLSGYKVLGRDDQLQAQAGNETLRHMFVQCN